MSGNGPVCIDKRVARRFVLGRQGLWPGRRWFGKAGTRDAVMACEHLQLDPLVIVARSHELMLHSRVVGFEAGFFDALAYEQRLFFDWGGWLAVRPMAELPYWRALMRRQREQPRMLGLVEHHGAAIATMRSLLRERGTLTSRDFKAADRRRVASYRGRKDSSLALYYLWLVGDAMTHHRDGFERVYAPTEAVAPAGLIYEASEADTDRFMARKAVAFAGIGRPGPLSRTLVRTVSKEEERLIEHALAESGELSSIEVEGWPGRHFVTADGVALLGDLSHGRVPAAWAPIEATTDEEVTLLSPLDPVIERRRAKTLFEFDYIWEIYKRQEHVKFGRYAMPILWGDRLVGRIDLRTDRRSSTLVINGVWLEDDQLARSAAFRDALKSGLERLLVFVKTDRIDATAVHDGHMRRAIVSLNPSRRAARR